MFDLAWDSVGNRVFETGIDRGVLYLADNSGVAWNGLVSVDEASTDSGDSSAFYLDGVKYVDISMNSDYQSSLKALTYPDAFIEYEGFGEMSTGLYSEDYEEKQFGLSYRTFIGSDTTGQEGAYKIHILWNLTAIADTTSFQTMTNLITPITFSWTLYGIPENITGYKPTAHAIIDSSLLPAALLAQVEDILYGNSAAAARLPSLQELADLIVSYRLIYIVDNGDGTWSATGPDDLVKLTDSDTIEIDQANANFTDADTYVITDTFE